MKTERKLTKREAQSAFTELYRYAWHNDLLSTGVEQALDLTALLLDLRLPAGRTLKLPGILAGTRRPKR